MERFEVDDTRQGERNVLHRTPWYSPSRLGIFLAYPIHLIAGVFRFVFGVLHIPIPQFRFTGLSFYRTTPRALGNIDTWVRELEEETGATCVGHTRAATSATGTEAGLSSLTSRGTRSDVAKVLPDFTTGSYEDALRACQSETRIGCIILVSSEHDDVAEFKRNTLTDPTFVKTLQDNDVIVWGGDVRDKDAWSASQKLQATTYPFVAFVALQAPRRTGSSSSTTPVLTVLSRHQGPSTPSTAPTSANTLVAHIQNQLVSRVVPFLDRIKSTARERDNDRRMREDQDRAFAESARKDKERIEAKINAERQARQNAQRAEEQERLDAFRREADSQAAAKRESLRMDWRRWMRKMVVRPEPSIGGLRIAVRVSGDTRVVRTFATGATLTQLYAFVDAQLIPGYFPRLDDPTLPPNGATEAGEDVLIRAVNEQAPGEFWGFKLVLAYPRKEIPWVADTLIVNVEDLKRGGQVVVEMNDLGRGRKSMDASVEEVNTEDAEGADNGRYDTESDSD